MLASPRTLLKGGRTDLRRDFNKSLNRANPAIKDGVGNSLSLTLQPNDTEQSSQHYSEITMPAALDLANPDRTIHVGVVLIGGETEILDVAPVDFFHGLTKDFIQDWPEDWLDPKLREQAIDFKFHWVNETGNPAKLTGGITLQPTDTFANAPVLDIVLMGAHNVGYQPNEVELAYVRKAYENSSAFITVCGGIQAALDAGVLKGKSATCPRFLLPYARKIAPDTKWEEKRWQRDGKLWTSGALLNGLDLVRAFGKEMWGGEGSLVNYWLEMGHFPERDVNYGDAPSKV